MKRDVMIVTIPQRLFKYKSFDKRTGVLKEANPHLDISEFRGSHDGDIELVIEVPPPVGPEVPYEYDDELQLPTLIQ